MQYQIKRQLLSAFVLTVTTLGIIAPTANATEFRIRTLQERQGETIVIEEDTIENFRARARKFSMVSSSMT
ncbi:MAG: hypothetical protein AAFO06_20890, partial [Cyanobacteria bacterium J06597_16]